MIPSNFLRHGPFKKRLILWAPSYVTSLSELALNTYELRLVFVDGQWWVVHGGSHWALLAKFPLLLFAHGMDFSTAHNVFGMEWHFSLRQFLCNLCGDWVLVRLVICVNTDKPDVTWLIVFQNFISQWNKTKWQSCLPSAGEGWKALSGRRLFQSVHMLTVTSITSRFTTSRAQLEQ